MSQNLTDEDQKELSTFLDAEQAKARVQSTVHAFTERCWDQCVKSSIGSHFGRGEEACLSNCVERFLDTSLFIVCVIERLTAGQKTREPARSERLSTHGQKKSARCMFDMSATMCMHAT
ncbi:hypothetical protein MGL_2229 [Malassezia globosa CBS 7966]|uniref:Mitochondrial import inner membrane translocase subunit n=1 Tax=Malassezia globosa (strain ATCC MYA-4612 / CBS 7966) TaxID=425265 RepID=A8Q2S6_MALGO|nr:uncharacterized protein MGL_2229 [Malassezia globosa CBS 7966]EDP43219.1 hypothetical protein MGL_2229 [Malassezia globosa CBS 7966]